MKLIVIPLLLFLGTAPMGAGDVETPNKILPYPIHVHDMPNGLRVVTVPYESPGIATFYIIVRAGSRDETEPGKSGFAHFFEHMMFRGTEKYPKERYNEILKSIGASANANTSNDRTVYHMTGNAEMLEKMFELEADRFMNLKYSIQDFKVEAGAVKGEYTKNFANPYMQLYEKVRATAFTKHTYGHTTMGFFEDIVDMPNQYEYSLQFFDRFYRPEYSTILVVGDVTPEKVNALAEKYFGSWKRGNYTTKVTPEPPQTETRYVHLQVPNFPPLVGLSFKGPAFSDKTLDMPALDVLSLLLFSEKSELFKKLVLEERKVRSLWGGAQDSRDPYLFDIQASVVDASDLQYVKDEIMKAIEKAQKEPVDPEELKKVVSNLKYRFAMDMDSPDAIAGALSNYIWITGDPEALNRTYANYEKVTPEDIMRVASKYLVTTGLTISTISPDEKGGVK
ncbi:MAG: pitrilysin family protein [Bacteroidota bacterium]|jgi:zinc protease|nr:MAG: insulinase family protein [Bacteroidota bacterium]